jgi:heat shock protein HtpX
MPITFIDIERQKSARIALLFIFLIVMYFFVTFSVFFGVSFFFTPFMMREGLFSGPSLLSVGVIFLLSLFIAACHFWFSSTNVVSSIMNKLAALPPDPKDGLHRQFLNIMAEIRVASGNKAKMQCLVIPSLSMNALAADDLKGEAVIAITEGLLSRLSREQLEAVIAHETYHVLSGDCRETTLATSLFGMYVTFFEKMRDFSDDDRRGDLAPSFLPLWTLLKLSELLSMFISREREYRADAASVRMTRNPLAMAEALHLLSRNWTGGGMISTGLEMLCIVNPVAGSLDETEGWWADLMTTHPPISNRIGLLLRMARINPATFEKRRQDIGGPESTSWVPGQWVGFALDVKKQWQGPFSMAELVTLPWLNPQTWISSNSVQQAVKASEIDAVRDALTERFAADPPASSFLVCPACRQPLREVAYEQTTALQCDFCGGLLVDNSRIVRIIARRAVPCTERVQALARAVLADNQRAATMRQLKKAGRRSMAGYTCSKCSNTMFRTFYSGAYLIEIDRCNICGFTWFDADELEMLQCLIENKITSRIGTI